MHMFHGKDSGILQRRVQIYNVDWFRASYDVKKTRYHDTRRYQFNIAERHTYTGGRMIRYLLGWDVFR